MKQRFLVLFGGVLLLLLAGAFLGGVFDRVPSFQGKSARHWARGLRYESVPQGEAMEAFQKMGTNSIPILLKEIQAQESVWRKWQRLVRSKLPRSFQTRFPLSPQGKFSRYQVCVVNVLTSIGPESTGLVIEALHKGRPEVRATCAWALGGFKANARLIAPELIRALNDPDANVRMYAANSLGDFGPEAAVAVPVLIKTSLNDIGRGPNGQAAYVQDASVRALGKIGPPAREAIPALKQLPLLFSNNTRLKVFAAIALWKIDRDSSIPLPVLTDHYEAWNDYEKWTVLQTFGDMGSNAISTVPMICDYLRKIADKPGFPEDEIRDESLKALWKIDPAAAEKIASELHLKLSRTDNR